MKPYLCFLLCLLTSLPIGLAVAFVARPADAQRWDWSPASGRHAAIVTIRSAGRLTSGVYVRHGELCGVLGVAHGTPEAEAEVTFSDGTKQRAAVTIDRDKFDLAWIFADHPEIKPLELSDVAPSIGDRVEFATFGGPAKMRLRHFYARVIRVDGQETRYDCDVISGDSGGAIVNAAGEVVGVQSTGGQPLAESSGWSAYRGAGSAGWSRLRAFVGRVAEACKDCRDGVCRPPGNLGPPRHILYPPALPPPLDPFPPSPSIPPAVDLVPPAVDLVPPAVDPVPPAVDPVTPSPRHPAIPSPFVDPFPPSPSIPAAVDPVPPAVNPVTPSPLPAIAGDLAGGGLLAALGWTGPPSLAAIAGLWLLRWWLKRRRSPPVAPSPPPPAPTEGPALDFPRNPPRDTAEAVEFLRLSTLEGRDPLHDALIGRLALDELDNQIEQDGDSGGWAVKLKRTLEDRFNGMVPFERSPARA